MSASPTPASTIPSNDRETASQRDERIFDSLSPLESPAYLILLKSATAAELPAQVLARAYRRLYPGPAADATLARLVGHNERYGFISMVYAALSRCAK